jgi:hypothetical protein
VLLADEINFPEVEPTEEIADLPMAVTRFTAPLLTTADVVLEAIFVADTATEPPACTPLLTFDHALSTNSSLVTVSRTVLAFSCTVAAAVVAELLSHPSEPSNMEIACEAMRTDAKPPSSSFTSLSNFFSTLSVNSAAIS